MYYWQFLINKETFACIVGSERDLMCNICNKTLMLFENIKYILYDSMQSPGSLSNIMENNQY